MRRFAIDSHQNVQCMIKLIKVKGEKFLTQSQNYKILKEIVMTDQHWRLVLIAKRFSTLVSGNFG